MVLKHPFEVCDPAHVETFDLRQYQVTTLDAGAVLDFLERGRALAQVFERLLQLVVTDPGLRARHAQFLVVAHFYFGPQIEGRAEAQRLGEVTLFGDDLRRQKGR